MRLTGAPTMLIVLAGVSACQTSVDSTPRVLVDIAVESDPGVRLSGVPIRVDGELAGRSDSNGLLQVPLSVRPGRAVRIEHDCPEGHRAPRDAKTLRVRSYHNQGANLLIELELKCRPEVHVAAFAVRATNGPDIPVLLNGEVVARTNGAGVAHFSISALAGTEYRVQLDATEHPALLPRRTSHLFTLPDSTELFVIDQAFEMTKKGKMARSRQRRIIKIE